MINCNQIRAAWCPLNANRHVLKPKDHSIRVRGKTRSMPTPMRHNNRSLGSQRVAVSVERAAGGSVCLGLMLQSPDCVFASGPQH